MTVDIKNPYREGSKLHSVFHFMSDGGYHTLGDITEAAYFPGAGLVTMYRRRTSSAIRTIRSLHGLFVDYDGSEYVMSEQYKVHRPFRTAAAADSHPSVGQSSQG